MVKRPVSRRVVHRIAPTVPKLWPESTVVVIASGPSLTAEDVDYCRGRARVICVNDNYRLAPWADCLYAADGAWWQAHKGVPSFTGLRYSIITGGYGTPKDVIRLLDRGQPGLELDPSGLRRGGNSGYQAINLAVHLGARRILLLGYDCQPSGRKDHWFGAHPSPLNKIEPRHYETWLRMFQTLVPPLARLGIEIVNCTRGGALQCFPRQSIEQALPVELEAAS